MSTQQPPEGSGYAQPQDPWEGGYEPGLASVPTDPIPEQRYEPAYPQGGPGFGPAEIWSQPTAARDGQGTRPESNRAGMVVLIVLIVLILGGGGGYAAWYVTKQRNTATQPTNGPTATATTTTTTPTFDPYTVKLNDCIRNANELPSPDTVDPSPVLEVVPCSTAKSYKVIKIVQGVQLKENAARTLDGDTTAVDACAGTAYRYWYAYDDRNDDAKDILYCMVASAPSTGS
jgi:hypothetical protein